MNDTSDQAPRVPAQRLRAFIAAVFVAAGLPDEDAHVLGELIAAADLRGTDTHGVFRMPLYVRRIKAGGINKRPDIKVVEERPATALLDGDNGMGHLVMRRAAELAIEKAKQTGVGWVGARMSNHAGPAALYAMMPLAHDMIGLYFAVGSNNHLPPTGSAEALLGTNPIAVAIPAGKEPAVVMDMAPTVAAFGKVRMKAALGEPMGYALSLIIGLLAGPLNGAAFGRGIVDFLKHPATATNTGQSILAVSVDAFCPADLFKENVDAAVRTIRQSQRLPGVERVWLPGEQSHTKRLDRLANGIPIPPALRKNLDALAQELGIEAIL